MKRSLLYWIGALPTSLLALSLYLTPANFNGNWRATLPDLVAGQAHKPFQFRVLLPWLAGLYPDPEMAVYPLLLAFLLVYLWAVRGLYRVWGLKHPDVTALFSTAGILLAVSHAYVYDIPALALFTLALWLILSEEHKRLEPFVFLLACLNKETALLLIPVILVVKRDYTSALYHLLIFAGVKVGLAWIFEHNPGVLLEWHLLDQWQYWTNHVYSLVNALVLLVMLAWLIQARWGEKPGSLKLTALLLLPPLVGLWALFGMPVEYRVFLEFWPVLVALCAPGLAIYGGGYVFVNFSLRKTIELIRAEIAKNSDNRSVKTP